MSNIPNLMDMDYYCETLSQITGLDVDTIRLIVMINFAKIYTPNNEIMDASDAITEIEHDVYAELEKRNNTKKVAQMSI